MINFRSWAWGTSAGLLGLYLLVSCSTRDAKVIPAQVEKRCVIIKEGSEARPDSWTAWLDKYLPEATRFDASQLDAAIQLCLQNDLALVLTDDFIQPEGYDALRDYLARGARLVFLGDKNPPGDIGRATLQASAGFTESTYSITTATFRIRGLEESVKFYDELQVTTPSPPARGQGGVRAHDARWIPVAEALGPDGGTLGWAASCMIFPQAANNGYSVYGWLGLNPLRGEFSELAPMVAALLTEATRDVYFLGYGLDRHAAHSQQPLKINARIHDRRLVDKSPLRVAARWINSGGMELRRHVTPPLEAPFLPLELSIGLAPDPGKQNTGMYRIEMMLRDRNDQTTFDTAAQDLKIFSPEYRTDKERVSVRNGQLMHGPQPVFMLGVNYWPRLAAPHAGSSANGHWLAPEWFMPDILQSDLDLLAAANINAVAIEYTDISQAPQLAFVLDELRRRSMWASVYMPSLHPLDLRMEEALAMLQAVNMNDWPEVFALEMARGINIPSRADMRRFDNSWADWLVEHFGSVNEAEQKTGVTVWRERNRVVGPPEIQLRRGPQNDRAIALYCAFLQDFASRRMGYIRTTLRAKGYETLLTARSAYGAPDDPVDALDISTGALHQDFLSPDAWTIHPLEHTHDDGPAMAAYVRGIGGGKPVLWSAYGHDVGRNPSAESLERQVEVYNHLLNQFINEGSFGAFAWWYPAGSPRVSNRDWGIMTPQGRWRPVEEAIRSARSKLRQTRLQPRVRAGRCPPTRPPVNGANQSPRARVFFPRKLRASASPSGFHRERVSIRQKFLASRNNPGR